MVYNWNDEKNNWLKSERGISFEDVIFTLEQNGAIAKIPHPNTEKYPHQKIYLVEIDNYIYEIPCIENEHEIFLKTIFPSRKYTKQLLQK